MINARLFTTISSPEFAILGVITKLTLGNWFVDSRSNCTVQQQIKSIRQKLDFLSS